MGTLVFQATLGGSVNLIGPNTASTINFTLPSADGSSGQTWTTNGSGVLSFGTLGVAGGGTGVTTSTGTGSVVLSTSPTLVTPLLGTPTSGNFSTGTFTWPTFNQNTSGTAAGLSATLAVASGGTGQTSYTNGQLLIGNTTGNTLTKATLTAGTGITITNSTGSITIASAGGSGDVVGPASATNNGIVLFDSTTGKLIKDSATSNGLIYGLTVGRGAAGVSSNTALGSGALSNASTTGGFNTALGRNTLVTLTSGEENTAVGNSVLNLATTGGNNVGVGNASLAATTTGGSNTALGFGALQRNTSASFNTAIGTQALTYNTTASNNTAVGYQAVYTNTTGDNLVAIGRESMKANTTGAANVSVGALSLTANTTGNYNTALGAVALGSNTTASSNTAVGYQAGQSNVTGTRGTFVGYIAGQASTGNYNTCVGAYAGYTITSGAANTLIGDNACSATLTTGSNNIYVGAQNTASAAGVNSEIIISGNGLTGKGSNTGFISPNGGGVYQGNNAATWSVTSDQRLKKNIVDNNIGLDAINSIRVRNFEYRLEEEITELPTNTAIKKTGTQLGVIAQELQAVLPDCVKTESTGVMSVNSDNLTWYMINAIKELKAEVDTLKSQLNQGA